MALSPPAVRAPVPNLRPHLLAARNGYRRGLQYRAAHMVNNLASAIFGMVYISIWRAALRSPGGSAAAARLSFSQAGIAHYVAVSQCVMWITIFLPSGLGVPAAVRTGQVTADLLRPVGFWGLQMAREAGGAAYSLIFRSAPMALLFAALVGLPRPASATAAAVAVIATLVAVWNALCMHYLVGVSAFWMTESRSAHYLLTALVMGAGGGTVPLRAFPAAVRGLLPWLPFASLLSTPALAWTGRGGAGGLAAALGWAVALGAMCAGATAAARRRLEVQGG